MNTNERNATSNELFDVGLARMWAGFVWRAMKRHKLRAALVALAVLGVTSIAVATAPAAYYADTVVLARRDTVSSQADNSRTVRPEDENPTASARAVVLRDENLRRMSQQLGLIDVWKAPRSLTAKAFSFVSHTLLRQPKVSDPEGELLKAMRDAISVSADEQELTIAVLWNDPNQAIAIANQSRENFLEDRRREIVGQAEAALSDWQREYDAAVALVQDARVRLGLPEESEAPLPDTSPLKELFALQERAGQELQRVRVNASTALTAFEFRFAEVRDAEPPAQSVGGRFRLLLLGIIGAMGLATLSAVFADLSRGRLAESWQVERRYRLPVLARLDGRS